MRVNRPTRWLCAAGACAGLTTGALIAPWLDDDERSLTQDVVTSAEIGTLLQHVLSSGDVGTVAAVGSHQGVTVPMYLSPWSLSS